MTIRMLINASAPHELRIAIVEDGELTELDIEASETSTLKGNVYKGVVHNVEGSLEAAFVDIGRHKQGFLPFSEVSPSQYHRPWSGKGRPKITDVLKRGQEIIVQVAKDAIGEKGATLTTYLSLPGRYTVLMPESEANGISRKIEDEKVRKRIKSIAHKMSKPQGCGFIVRTAGLGQTRLALQRDLDNVVEQWKKLEKAAKIARAPSIVHSEPDLIGRTLRDFFSDEIDEVLIDSKEEYEAARDYFQEVMPSYVDRLVHYQNPIPIFAYYRVEEQIESTFERQVKLPSGGSIVVDETEALVAIDVNSGKMTSEGDHEKTVFKTNCEAAEEAARQLKLRDLGGIVVVDFIDMEESKNKREVERVLAEAAKGDKARYKISRINAKGLCVLTRQRIRQGMRKAFQYRCPVCTGTGWLRTGESHALSVLRRVEARLAQGGVGEVRVLTHKETADYVLNQKRGELVALERNYGCRILVTARADMDRGKDEVTYLSNKQVLDEITDKLPPREERRSRGGKRKKRKKRGVEAPAETAEAASPDTEAEARTKRRRKRRRGRSGDAEAAEALAEAKAAEAGGSAAPRESEPEAELEPKGTATFTGRLSPEEIARAKAERKARKARREGDRAAPDQGLAEPSGSEAQADAEPSLPAEAAVARSEAAASEARREAPVSRAEAPGEAAAPRAEAATEAPGEAAAPSAEAASHAPGEAAAPRAAAASEAAAPRAAAASEAAGEAAAPRAEAASQAAGEAAAPRAEAAGEAGAPRAEAAGEAAAPRAEAASQAPVSRTEGPTPPVRLDTPSEDERALPLSGPEAAGLMDVDHAIAVANAVLEGGDGDYDEDAVLEAAGFGGGARAEAAASASHGETATRVGEEEVARASPPAPTESAAASELIEDSGGDAEAGPEARAGGEARADGDSEDEKKPRRRRRRRGRKRKTDGDADTEVNGQGEAAPRAPIPPVVVHPPAAPAPEVTAARKALLVRIFGAR